MTESFTPRNLDRVLGFTKNISDMTEEELRQHILDTRQRRTTPVKKKERVAKKEGKKVKDKMADLNADQILALLAKMGVDTSKASTDPTPDMFEAAGVPIVPDTDIPDLDVEDDDDDYEDDEEDIEDMEEDEDE